MDEKLFLCESFIQAALQDKVTDKESVFITTINKNGEKNNIYPQNNEKISQLIYNILTNKEDVEKLSKICICKTNGDKSIQLNEIDIY